jgi:hypothetical protein
MPLIPNLYQPEHNLSGPAYGAGFKAIATAITLVLLGYGASIALRYPMLLYGFGLKVLLVGATALLLLSYYWFLRSRTTIDARGISQSWVIDKQVRWDDIRGAKMIGIPYASWLFPPRLVVRTGNSFTTFNGGSRELLVEFAKISLAFQMNRSTAR